MFGAVSWSTYAAYSAIMKYHSLKMEELNDTMRHLWNKTYQGTGRLCLADVSWHRL